MTRDAITEANRIINNIKEASEFWKNHQYKNDIPDDLISRIDTTIEEYIADMENKLEYLSGYFEYDDDKK